ncbi:Mu transposase domain-containing protein [uncultured Cellulomonas sp.]|uniref:Mu transposase domain-containing protein n=1 Tax=uncultured Cellulomonas sp. TaxID=189682 RepID=UPI00260E3849|nr:hypothetical protein [uncultured Cellulomonas sp.]
MTEILFVIDDGAERAVVIEPSVFREAPVIVAAIDHALAARPFRRRSGRDGALAAGSTGLLNRVRLGRDYCVRIASNDFSEDPRTIGPFVDVLATSIRVLTTCDGQVAADQARCWVPESGSPTSPQGGGRGAENGPSPNGAAPRLGPPARTPTGGW